MPKIPLKKLCLFPILCIFSLVCSAQQTKKIRIYLTDAQINPNTTQVIFDNRLKQGKGLSSNGNVTELADVSIQLDLPSSNRYVLSSYALTDSLGKKLMKGAKTKFESMMMTMQIDQGQKTKRAVYVPWDVPLQELGKFQLQKNSTLKLWIPAGIILDYIELVPYTPPAVPAIVQQYKPRIVPPAAHPRLWVSPFTLPTVRQNLIHPDHQSAWKAVQELALKPFPITFKAGQEVSFNADLEKALEAKAFYYLITQDLQVGQEAVALAKNYVSYVEFGNLLDITREIGRTIHIVSEVFDWCNNIIKPADKALFHQHLIRLAEDMEIGWPPYLQSIINGHGNEAQVNRDLLSMSIALYDEDPMLYTYCAYGILEELVPMRKWEYQSPRHNQGINYGIYRFNWDLHAAWLFERMSDTEVFDANIKQVGDYWIYARLPDGQMLRDGDQSLTGKPGAFHFWQINALSYFMNYTYAENPYLKKDFERMENNNHNAVNPVLYLLLNNPELKAEELPKDYPLTKDFGPILGGMINRTGWELDLGSNNVVAEIKGGGYHFANHQQSDAGALQIYHRGFQVADLGLYKFYGTPYDMNFNKRSVAHSMMLAIDPQEKFGRYPANDGGTRLNRTFPTSPQQAVDNPQFHNGSVISVAYGPQTKNPTFNYFAADLTSAYSTKIKSFVREYIFINTQQEDIPAIILLKDQMETSQANVRKYWQINTLETPHLVDGKLQLRSSRAAKEGVTHVQMLYPDAPQLDYQILSGQETYNIFGVQVEPPPTGQAEENGHRILVSPKKLEPKNSFLSVFQMTNAGVKPLSVVQRKVGNYDFIYINKALIIFKDGASVSQEILHINIPKGDKMDVFITGLADGTWILKKGKENKSTSLEVIKGQNTSLLNLKQGNYTLTKQLKTDE